MKDNEETLMEGIDNAMERQGLLGEGAARVVSTMTDVRMDDKDLNQGASIAMTAVMRHMKLPIIDKHAIKSGFYDVLKTVYGGGK